MVGWLGNSAVGTDDDVFDSPWMTADGRIKLEHGFSTTD